MPRKPPAPKPAPLPAKQMGEVEAAIRRWVGAGATFALCGADKVPLRGKEWGKRGSPVMRSAEEVVAHLKADPSHCVAVVLESVGLGLVDMDGAPVSEQSRWVRDVFAKGAPPLCVLRSQSGRHHLYYRVAPGATSLLKASRRWRLPRLDGVAGDRDAKDRDARPLYGDICLPCGTTGMLPGTNVVALAAAVLDRAADEGAWDPELDELLRVPRGDNLPAQLTRLRGSPSGAHNSTLNEVTYYAAPFRPGGLVERALTVVACATGHAPARVRATIRSAYQGRVQGLPGFGGGRVAGVGKVQAGSAPPATSSATSASAAARGPVPPGDREGVIKAGRCAAGVADALARIGAEVAVLDDFAGALGIRYVGEEWAPIQLSDRARLGGALRNRFRYEVYDRRTETRRLAPFAVPAQELVEHLWEVAGARHINTMGDFLAECDRFSDREEAYAVLQGFIDDLWEVDPACREIAGVAIPSLLIGAVGRHLEPGAKMDAMTILASAPGMGKSSFVRGLLPSAPEFGRKVIEGFRYGSRAVLDDDEQMGKLRGAALVEFTELSPHGTDIDRLKGFVDRRVDTYRPKYGTDALPHPRTCVLVATSNRVDVLPHDPAGHRKFWVVRLERMAAACARDADTADFVTAYLETHRKRLWGAAVACWHGWREETVAVHPKLSMPRHLWDRVTEIAGEGSAIDPLVQGLIDRVESLGAEVDWLAPQEVAEMSGRVPVRDGDYVAAPDGLLKQVRAALESVRPAWTRVQCWVVLDGRRRRMRLYRRANVGWGGDLDWDREERRRALGIPAPVGGSGPAPATEDDARGRRWGVYPGREED